MLTIQSISISFPLASIIVISSPSSTFTIGSSTVESFDPLLNTAFSSFPSPTSLILESVTTSITVESLSISIINPSTFSKTLITSDWLSFIPNLLPALTSILPSTSTDERFISARLIPSASIRSPLIFKFSKLTSLEFINRFPFIVLPLTKPGFCIYSSAILLSTVANSALVILAFGLIWSFSFPFIYPKSTKAFIAFLDQFDISS